MTSLGRTGQERTDLTDAASSRSTELGYLPDGDLGPMVIWGRW
ncbi:MAG: hypothetical protein M0005_16275 [Actinomycetota bacterium]|nr:hypothetical protein [Actinomycetota bacterium]